MHSRGKKSGDGSTGRCAYGHHVAEGQLRGAPVKLAPVGPHARHPPAVDVPAAAPGGAKPVKLPVAGLPVGRDAGVADEPVLR
jgi:hypothetical protein